MPHAEDQDVSDGDDDFNRLMRHLTGGGYEQAGGQFNFIDSDMEPGEKADDAVDYADFDFDTDSLPEEEPSSRRPPTSVPPSVPPSAPPVPPPTSVPPAPAAPTAPTPAISPTALPAPPEDEPAAPEDPVEALFGTEEDGLFESREDAEEPVDELAELFGEGRVSPEPDQMDDTRDLFFEDEHPPVAPEPVEPPAPEPVREPVPEPEPVPVPVEDVADQPMPQPEAAAAKEEEEEKEEEMDAATLRAWKLQMELFSMSTRGPEYHPPAPPENFDELLFSLFPSFNRKDLPRWLQLIPPKKAYFVGNQPLKPPKPVLPTKIHLELAQDQERAFNASGQGFKRTLEADHLGVVPIETPEVEDDLGEDFEQETDNEILPGGVTLQDLRVICADWDVPDEPVPINLDEEPPVEDRAKETHEIAEDDDWFFETTRPAKKRKTGRDPSEIVALSHLDVPIADDLEDATSRIAKKVTVDLNDPHLLIDQREPDSTQRTRGLGSVRDEVDAGVNRRLTQRYNISNDSAYDMLKQNHQNKIRNTLGNVTLEHAMPALRLQWPYYKTELAKAEARSFHRPALSFRPGQTVWFKNPTFVKRKHQRGKDVRNLYDSTKSLSLGDNSNALLVEYSEEVPFMLSNFGMSNRFINYYRRKNIEDPTRPKADIGETVVLLPQDKSPFSIFGHVDPGEITPAISNSMYRAPLFPQKAKSNDFLVVRSTTGTGGSDYFIRNIENLYIAGQQFPSVDVPGPHSRKVTTVAKNRMKMLVYRLLKRSPDLRLSISEVTAHIPGTTDMQNRQKVKDFLQHDKDSKYWVPLERTMPESDTIRSWVHPEDVCLLESMQVGQQHLQDTGFGNDAETGGDDDNDEEGESFEQQMAPWKATRSFLLASQGKAMLKLHGEGDPTGRGEGFSFIKTSMKGGFKPVGESVEDKIEGQKLKEQGGHSYNVARQQKAYETSIRRIWEAQKASLSSTIEHDDYESDRDQEMEEEEEFNKPTPRSEATPAFRRDDETGSQFSKMSMRSQKGKVLRIVRKIPDEKTGEIIQKEQMVWDPRVIRQYMQYRYRVESVSTKYVPSFLPLPLRSSPLRLFFLSSNKS